MIRLTELACVTIRGDLREAVSPSKETYRRLLAEKLLNNRTCILAFRNEPYEPENVSATVAASSHHTKPAKQR